MPSIIIIDDSRDIHRLVRSAFVDESWQIRSAYSGSEGLMMATALAADLVLLDVDLPDLNGFDVCRHLKADLSTSRAAVIFLTASSSIDERVCGLQLEAIDFVTKPFEPAELCIRAKSALRIKSMLDAIPNNLHEIKIKDEVRFCNHLQAGH